MTLSLVSLGSSSVPLLPILRAAARAAASLTEGVPICFATVEDVVTTPSVAASSSLSKPMKGQSSLSARACTESSLPLEVRLATAVTRPGAMLCAARKFMASLVKTLGSRPLWQPTPSTRQREVMTRAWLFSGAGTSQYTLIRAGSAGADSPAHRRTLSVCDQYFFQIPSGPWKSIALPSKRPLLQGMMAEVSRIRAPSLAAASSNATRPPPSVAVLTTACPPVMRATRLASLLAPPRWPLHRLTAKRPRSSMLTRAGSVALLVRSGAARRMAMPVAPTQTMPAYLPQQSASLVPAGMSLA